MKMFRNKREGAEMIKLTCGDCPIAQPEEAKHEGEQESIFTYCSLAFTYLKKSNSCHFPNGNKKLEDCLKKALEELEIRRLRLKKEIDFLCTRRLMAEMAEIEKKQDKP